MKTVLSVSRAMITFQNIESVISFIDNATFEAVVRKNKVYNKRGELVAAVEIKKGENKNESK